MFFSLTLSTVSNKLHLPAITKLGLILSGMGQVHLNPWEEFFVSFYNSLTAKTKAKKLANVFKNPIFVNRLKFNYNSNWFIQFYIVYLLAVA